MGSTVQTSSSKRIGIFLLNSNKQCKRLRESLPPDNPNRSCVERDEIEIWKADQSIDP
jgi:hypothetical protein